MNKFCANPLCRCHVECREDVNRLAYTEANGTQVSVRRFVIADDRGQSWTFCEVCANVLATTNGEKPKNENIESTQRPGEISTSGTGNPVGGQQRNALQSEDKELRRFPKNYAPVEGPGHCGANETAQAVCDPGGNVCAES